MLSASQMSIPTGFSDAEPLFDDLSWAKNTHDEALQVLAAILHRVENGLFLIDRNEEPDFAAIAGLGKQRDPVGQHGLAEVASPTDRLAAGRIGGQIQSHGPCRRRCGFGEQDRKALFLLRQIRFAAPTARPER